MVLEYGQIIEEGTHDDLIEKNGRYAELFEMQGKYYREEQEKKERIEAIGKEEA